MTTCTHLSDLMPATALGQRSWSPEEARHLECCADCRAEWEVVRNASQLGVEQEDLDWALTLRTAQGRARTAGRSASHVRWIAAGLVAAAALILVLRLAPRPASGPASTVSTVLTIPALAPLSEQELQSVLAAMSAPGFATDTELGAPGLESLDSASLLQVLTALEGT